MRAFRPRKFKFLWWVMVLAGSITVGVVWATTYKTRLLRSIERLAAENLEGRLSIQEVGFTPFRHGLGITFSFYNVTLVDHQISAHHTPLLSARVFTVRLSLRKLMQGQVVVKALGIENGTFRIFVAKDGYSNATLFKKIQQKINHQNSEKPKSNFFGNLTKLSFYDCPVQYVDSLKSKKYVATFRQAIAYPGRTDSVLSVQLDGTVFFGGLTFNAAKGSFLRKKEVVAHLSLAYFPQKKLWQINPSSFDFPSDIRDKIELTGFIDLSKSPKTLALDFSTERANLGHLAHLLPQTLEKAILRRKIVPEMKADLHIRGAIGRPTPLVTIEFETDTFRYALPYGFLREIKARGTFTNRHDPGMPIGDRNSRIEISHAKGFFETIPLVGKMSITDLKEARSAMDFRLVATPKTVNALLDTNRYAVHSGVAVLTFHYEGSPVVFFDAKTDRMTGRLKGKVDLQNVALASHNGDINVSNLYGKAYFNEDQVLLPKLSLHDGRNDVTISGKVLHLPASLFGSLRPAEAYVHVDIPDWTVTWPDRFAGRKQTRKLQGTKFKLTELLDKTIDKLVITASLASDRMKYHRMEATQLRGKVLIKDRLIELKNLSMYTCGGGVNLSGSFRTFEGKALPLFYAKGKVSNANLESVFYSLRNFGQKTITDKNLKGILTADFEFQSKISHDTALVLPTMKGYVNVNLEKVRIINFKPMLDIRKMVFKNRAWDNVAFAPIRTKFVLKGEEILVDRMKVQANVMYFFLDGIYSFGDKTNLSIQIPLNNLKRKAPVNQMEVREVEDVKGNILFLRAVHEGEDVRIRYDKIHRFQ